MKKADATPWTHWLFAASRLGVPPAAFWALSLREWRALAEPADAGALTRAAFQELATRFPDDMT